MTPKKKRIWIQPFAVIVLIPRSSRDAGARTRGTRAVGFRGGARPGTPSPWRSPSGPFAGPDVKPGEREEQQGHPDEYQVLHLASKMTRAPSDGGQDGHAPHQDRVKTMR